MTVAPKAAATRFGRPRITLSGARRRGVGRRGPRCGALTILALFLAASAALRLGSGIGTALALVPDDALPPAPAQCAAPPGEVAAALAEKAAALSVREAALSERLAALSLAEEAAARRIAEMQATEVALNATIAKTDGAAASDIDRLVAIYEVMKPAEAAAIFDTMAPDFAAGFLGAMRPEAAGAILGRMAPETAYGVSALIAGRNARAPKN